MGLEAAKSSCYGVSIDLPKWGAALFNCTSAKAAQEKLLATSSILINRLLVTAFSLSLKKTLGDAGLSGHIVSAPGPGPAAHPVTTFIQRLLCQIPANLASAVPFPHPPASGICRI